MMKGWVEKKKVRRLSILSGIIFHRFFTGVPQVVHYQQRRVGIASKKATY